MGPTSNSPSLVVLFFPFIVYLTHMSMHRPPFTSETRPGATPIRKHTDSNSNFIHIRLHPQCGVCTYFFKPGDQVASITVPHFNNSGRWVVLDQVEYPEYPESMRTDMVGQRYSFCRDDGCNSCFYLPETASVHMSCLNLYRTLVSWPDKWRRLMRVCISRHPWTTSQILRMEPRCTRNITVVMARAAQVTGLAWLADLPFPAIDIILKHLHSSANEFIRLCAAEDVYRGMLGNEGREIHELSVLRSWSRGAPPVLSESDTETPILLTIDARGIRNLERLVSSPAAASRGRHDEVYSVIIPRKGHTFKIEDGRGRLKPAYFGDSGQWIIWDIPNPLALEDCSRLLPLTPKDPGMRERRFITVSLAECTGLTFFVSGGVTRAVHRHSVHLPDALDTFKLLPQNTREYAIWVYVPIAPGDRVTGLSLRYNTEYEGAQLRRAYQECTYVFETLLGGVFIAGPDLHGKETIVRLDHNSTLIFDFFKEGVAYCFGAYSPGKTRDQLLTTKELMPGPRYVDWQWEESYSFARLIDVDCVWVYRDEDTELLRGLVIGYQNGNQRALGSCRTGLDRVEKCAKLEDLYFQSPWSDDEPCVKVSLGSAPENQDDEEAEWQHLIEGRSLKIWCSGEGTFMAQSIPDQES